MGHNSGAQVGTPRPLRLGPSVELVAVGLHVPRMLGLPLLGHRVRPVQQHLVRVRVRDAVRVRVGVGVWVWVWVGVRVRDRVRVRVRVGLGLVWG